MARSILVIIWHLLARSRAARFTDLGPGYYQARTDKDQQAASNHIRQIEALLGHAITITNAA